MRALAAALLMVISGPSFAAGIATGNPTVSEESASKDSGGTSTGSTCKSDVFQPPIGQGRERMTAFFLRRDVLEAKFSENGPLPAKCVKARQARVAQQPQQVARARQSPCECKDGTKAEEDAFRQASITNAGLSQEEAALLDFTCRKHSNVQASASTDGEQPTANSDGSGGDSVSNISDSQQAGTESASAGLDTAVRGSAAPIGNYSLTWQSDGTGWSKKEAWHGPGGHAGYGDVWDEQGPNVSEGNGETTLSVTECNAGGKQWCGSEITTRGIKDDFVHGYVEIEAKIPDGKSLFPAPGWLLGNGKWPATGEIDFAELVNNTRDDGKVYFSTHWAGCGGKCQISDPHPPIVATKSSEWHTYGVERTHDYVRQYVDGQLTGEITREQAAAKGDGYSVIFDTPMHLRADIGSGGAWAEAPGGARDPGQLQIRNVKVFE